MRKALIVLGVHRGGTSAITRLLSLAGAELPQNLLAPQPDNPLGYWESADIIAVHDELLLSLGRSWHDPLPLPAAWFGSEEARRFEDRLLEILWRDFARAPLFVIKDPRMCRLVPLWRSVLARFDATPLYVIALRHPLEVAESLQRRDGFHLDTGLLAWLLHYLEAERDTRGERRAVVSYDDVLSDWKGVIDRLSKALDVEFPKGAAAVEKEVNEFLQPGQRHSHHVAADLDGRAGIGAWTAAAYACLSEAGKGGSITAAALLDETRARMEDSLAIIRPALEDEVRRAAAAEARLDGLQDALKRAREESDARGRALEEEREKLWREQKAAREVIDRERDERNHERAAAIAEMERLREERDREVGRLTAELEYQQSRAELYTNEAAARAHYQARLESVHRSLSWRITAPLRLAKAVSLALRHQGLRALLPPARFWLRCGRAVFRALPLPAPLRARLGMWLYARFPALAAARAGDSGPPVSYEALDQAFRLRVVKPSAKPGPMSFNAVPSPLVSIIVPVCNKVEYTLACLKSIHDTCGGESYEVLVVDDASTDATRELVRKVEGVRYLRNEKNAGFVRSCNRGAAEARGRYLVFLNNDTVVQPGWLAELVKTMRIVPGAGLVGSQLINADGTLQESGGIVWADGNGWNYGRGEDRRRPEFNFLRDTDYCSGASVLIPKDLFEELGGFEECYAPAYYEDTDLAFKVRKAGRRVLVQPLSRVVHFEGVTSGTDLSAGVKQYQVRNRGIFRERWKDALGRHLPGPPGPGFRADRGGSGRVLIIDSYTPMPDRDSGSVDAFFLMQTLKDLDYSVTFVADDNPLHAGIYTEDLQRIGVECMYFPFLDGTGEFIRRRGGEFDYVLLTRVPVAARHIDLVRKYCRKARVGFITVDLHYLREEREAEVLNSERARENARLTRELEFSVMRKSDVTVLKSSREQQLIANALAGCRTHLLPLILDAPNRRNVAFRHRGDFLFVGSFAHPPNGDAVQFLVDEIWPRVRERLPEAVLRIVGSHMPPEIRGIRAEGVDVVGHVRDLSVYFNRTRVFVAPLRYGAGVKGKLGRSLAYGVPCVATGIAVEGMGLANGREVLVAEGAGDFAEACVRLYTDEALWERLSAAGLAHFEREMSLAVGRERIRGLMEALDGAVQEPAMAAAS